MIVFEYLEMKGKIRGSRKQRLHMWRKRDVQKRCTHLAHRKGMRVSRVCAWNTSALAFDGSGKVERSAENHSLCRFSTGKQYNCDLSASYNIGKVFTGGKSPCSKAQKLMCLCGPAEASRGNGSFIPGTRGRINAGR